MLLLPVDGEQDRLLHLGEREREREREREKERARALVCRRGADGGAVRVCSLCWPPAPRRRRRCGGFAAVVYI